MLFVNFEKIKSMKFFKIIRALLILALFATSCASKNASMTLNDIWVVTQIDGESVKPSENTPTLEINTKEMKVFGTDGCNNYTGSIEKLTSKSIQLGALASTRKMCFEMETPDAYNQAINKVTTYKRDHLNLYFFDSEGNKILSFKKTV